MDSTPPPSDQPATPPAEQAPPPPQQYAPQYAAPSAYGSAPPRPAMVTAAGVIMIIFGAILCLFGVLFLIGGAFVGGSGAQFENQLPGIGVTAGAVAGVIIVFAFIFLALGILDIVAGASVMSGRGWARITGIVLAAIFALFSLLGLGSSSQNGGIVITLLVIAGNAFVIWALATTGAWFASRAR